MSFDLSKLTPIEEFEVTIDCDCHEDHSKGSLFWACLPMHPTRELAGNEAAFHQLARLAFDVMMRRGWYVAPSVDGKRWFVCPREGGGCLHVQDRKEFFASKDPFTALVEADEWYRENVEVMTAEPSQPPAAPGGSASP